MKARNSKPLTPAQKAELAAVAELPDEVIDTAEMPGVRDWRGAQRGLLFRPVKRQLTLRLDADVIAWFQSRATEGQGYQTGINRALREYVTQHGGKAETP